MSEEDEIWKKLREIDRVIDQAEPEGEAGITTSEDIDYRMKYKAIVSDIPRRRRKGPEAKVQKQRRVDLGDAGRS